MRELKFRAWDNIRKRMMTSSKFVEFRFNSKGKVDAVNYSPAGGLQNLEVMQFTGLQDVNDVDIYEGDIVKTTYDQVRIEAVEYDPSVGFIPLQDPCDYGNIYLGMNDVEVIGNI